MDNLNDMICPPEDNKLEELQQEEYKLVCALFKNETGRIYLSEMEKKQGPIYKSGMTLDQVAYKQGQADFIKKIQRIINGN